MMMRHLKKIYNSLIESDKDWLVCGCNHTQNDGHDFYWTMMPGWNDDILRGVNSISSPSVLAFKNDKVSERFDENVRMMMDVEMYYHLDKNHGQPFYLMDDIVTNRVHSEQLSSKINSDVDKDDIIKAEVNYCIKNMSNYFLTTFNKKLYDEYAKDLINTYLDTNQHIPLYCYVEEDDFSIYPQHSKNCIP